uniref:EGF-like domain-containing protein n=1 Tax=Parastrongyloides trichosuri TaxID=131310 RepID=A0A0N4ZDY9_PARTI
MNWNLSVAFVFLSLILNHIKIKGEPIPIKLFIRAKTSSENNFTVKIDDIKSTEENIIKIYKEKGSNGKIVKEFKDVKIVRIEMEKFEDGRGVHIKIIKDGDINSNKYFTSYDGSFTLDSQKLEKKTFQCDESACNNGIVIISDMKIHNIDEVVKGQNAFFLLFVHKDIYLIKMVHTVEKVNRLVRCPHKTKWMKETSKLKYEYIPAYSKMEHVGDSKNHLLVPAQRTRLNKNIMECGSLYFDGKKVFSIGYSLRFYSGGPNVKTFRTGNEAKDCTNAVPTSSPFVYSYYFGIEYIPIESSFDDVPRIFTKENNFDFFSNSIRILYLKESITKLDTKVYISFEPHCINVIANGTVQVNFTVEFILDGSTKELIEKDFTINGKKETVRVYELNLSSDKLINDREDIKYGRCEIKQKANIKYANNFYTYMYKPMFVKKNFDGVNSENIPDFKYRNKFDNSIEVNNFTMFGLYQCISIDRTGQIKYPKGNISVLKYFAILPKEKSIIKVDVKVDYEKDLKGKGTCLVDKEGFGKLEELTLEGFNHRLITIKLSDLNVSNKHFKYNNDKTQVIYKGHIKIGNVLTCVYETQFNRSFSEKKKFVFRASNTTAYLTGHRTRSDHTPIIVASVVAFGFIAIAVVVAFVLLRRRHRRRKRRHRHHGHGSKTSVVKTGISIGLSGGLSKLSKTNKKSKVEVSTSRSEESFDSGDKVNIKNIIGAKEIIRLTAK